MLELGTGAEFVQRDRFTIRSVAAEEFPNLLPDGEVGVNALLAKADLMGESDHPSNTIARRKSRSQTDPRFNTLTSPRWRKAGPG